MTKAKQKRKRREKAEAGIRPRHDDFLHDEARRTEPFAELIDHADRELIDRALDHYGPIRTFEYRGEPEIRFLADRAGSYHSALRADAEGVLSFRTVGGADYPMVDLGNIVENVRLRFRKNVYAYLHQELGKHPAARAHHRFQTARRSNHRLEEYVLLIAGEAAIDRMCTECLTPQGVRPSSFRGMAQQVRRHLTRKIVRPEVLRQANDYQDRLRPKHAGSCPLARYNAHLLNHEHLKTLLQESPPLARYYDALIVPKPEGRVRVNGPGELREQLRERLALEPEQLETLATVEIAPASLSPAHRPEKAGEVASLFAAIGAHSRCPWMNGTVAGLADCHTALRETAHWQDWLAWLDEAIARHNHQHQEEPDLKRETDREARTEAEVEAWRLIAL